jgi:hypothetical protein
MLVQYTCINLLERFGDRYKIAFDEAYNPRHLPKDRLDPWMMVIPCRGGVIYPYGRDLLAVEVDGHPGAAKALAATPGVRLYQDGDREQTFLFPIDLFERVAAIVRPRKRRRLTESHRAALARGSARRRFRSKAPTPPSRLSCTWPLKLSHS